MPTYTGTTSARNITILLTQTLLEPSTMLRLKYLARFLAWLVRPTLQSPDMNFPCTMLRDPMMRTIILAHTHTHTMMHTHSDTHTVTYTHTHTHTQAHTHTHTHTMMHTHSDTHTYTHTQ